jgi:DNA polymerase/3'-5' exonuclease PolX
MSSQYSSLPGALELLAQIADARSESYRAIAYRRAIAMPDNAGSRVSAKIREYRSTGRIRELDRELARDDVRAMLELNDILGIGPATVRELVASGIKSRADLVRAIERQTVDLTRVQLLGVQYFDDLHRKIPRANVSAIAEIVLSQIYRAADACAKRMRAEIAGSYRRGARESGDIDIVVGPRDEECNHRAFLHDLHEIIRERDDFVGLIMIGAQKYSFLMRYRAHVVHVDIFYASPESYFAALLYATGSQQFNIRMREHCKKDGFTLNQEGLTKDGRAIAASSEEDIFAAVGLQYVPPNERN